MARILQGSTRVFQRPAPKSYDGKPHTLIFRAVSLPGLARVADPDAGGAAAKRFKQNDVIEMFVLPRNHAILNVAAKASANLSGTFKVGVLKGNVGKKHTGTGTTDENRQLSLEVMTLADNDATMVETNIAVANVGKLLADAIFGAEEKEQAFGIICTADSSADETAEIDLFVEYFDASRVD